MPPEGEQTEGAVGKQCQGCWSLQTRAIEGPRGGNADCIQYWPVPVPKRMLHVVQGSHPYDEADVVQDAHVDIRGQRARATPKACHGQMEASLTYRRLLRQST